MKKIISALFLSVLVSYVAVAADAPSAPSKPNAPTPVPRVSIFSTSTDWEAVTGLRLHEYRGNFKYSNNNKLIGRGLVLFYLDGFPCYGLGAGVRVWLGPRGEHDGELRIACVHAPTEIKFAWRNATRDADQAVTEGILTCPVTGDRDLTIDLSKCTRGPDWDSYK